MRSKIRSMLVAVLALCAVTAVTASAASAAIKYEWMVGKTPLASGVSDKATGTIKTGKEFKFKYRLSGVTTEFASPQIKFTGALEGGKPGTGTINGLTFEKITVKKPAKCALNGGTLTFNSIKTTIVEGAGAGSGDGKALILLQPKTGSLFASYELEGSECPEAGSYLDMTGSILAEGTQSEASPQTLTVLPLGSEYIPHGGTATKAELEIGAEPVTLEGLSEEKLATESPFAAL
jgi:hypothetical protein